MAESCEPVVSIQRATAADPVAGHLAWGALVDRDAVVVPGPLDWLDQADGRLDVLLASAQFKGPGLVERIAPTGIQVLGLDSNPAGAVALVRLMHPSRHRPNQTVVDSGRLTDQIQRTGDVWSALEAEGAVPPGIRDLPVGEVLGPVNDWEVEIRANLVTTTLYRTPGEVSINWCWISPRCHCPPPWWRR